MAGPSTIARTGPGAPADAPRVTPEGVDPGGRIAGIDIARGLAILGMFTVHVQFFGTGGEDVGGTAGAVLTAPGGRAAVLFFLLSGVSLSLIAGRGSLSAAAGVLRRRGFALLFFGLVLSTSFIWSGSILEHYGVMFLMAPWLLLASDRVLTALGIGGIVLGPVALLMVRPFTEDVAGFSDGAIGGVIDIAWSLGVDGLYPLLVWFGFFAVGMRIGRLNLRSRQVGASLLAVGAAIAIAVPLVVHQIEDAGILSSGDGQAGLSGELTEAEKEQLKSDEDFGLDEFDDAPDRDPEQLLDTTEHSGQTAWAMQASAIAMAILGAALLLPRLGQRLLWPLAAVGSISLSAYLIHIVLVTDVWDYLVVDSDWTVREQIGILFGLELALVAICAAIVWRWGSGPAERVLRWVSRR